MIFHLSYCITTRCSTQSIMTPCSITSMKNCANKSSNIRVSARQLYLHFLARRWVRLRAQVWRTSIRCAKSASGERKISACAKPKARTGGRSKNLGFLPMSTFPVRRLPAAFQKRRLVSRLYCRSKGLHTDETWDERNYYAVKKPDPQNRDPAFQCIQWQKVFSSVKTKTNNTFQNSSKPKFWCL